MYDLETPALLLHLDIVERNVEQMAARARQLGVALRPHAKTHKCVALGRLQVEHGARGLAVATLNEAEVFARAGFAGELTVTTLSQEHGLIRAESPAELDGRFTVGSQLELIPNHSCLTVAHFDEYHVVRGTGDGGQEVDRWKVERGR
jgi:D-serine deaminase-like pyridoxal phosphate-dependent protein